MINESYILLCIMEKPEAIMPRAIIIHFNGGCDITVQRMIESKTEVLWLNHDPSHIKEIGHKSNHRSIFYE